MALHTDYDRVRGVWLPKSVTVAKLKELLAELEDEHVLVPNRVGNLTVCQKVGDRGVGFVDVAGEEVCWFEEER